MNKVACLMLVCILLLHTGFASSTNYFLSTWDTRSTSPGSSNSGQITLPLQINGEYNFKVNWGDGSFDIITSYNQEQVTHSYESPGVYSMAIEGKIMGFNFNNQGDKLKLLEINQFGDLSLGDNENGGYFYGCSNLVINAIDVLDLKDTTILISAFRDCAAITSISSANQWNTSAITNMAYMFSGAINFNESISNWNTWQVISMSYMFQNAIQFDQDLSSWSVGNILGSMYMFTTLSTANYDKLLIGWSAQNLHPMVMFGAGNSKYTANSPAAQARTRLMNKAWSITDGGSA